MPRKTRRNRRSRREDAGFNEAAARCRGKPAAVSVPAVAAALASMRPRPDAAENATIFCGDPGPWKASMRPRPDAAENPTTAKAGFSGGGPLQ